MYRVAVCEDERDARELICGLCREILTGLETEYTVSGFSSAEELAAALDGGERFELLCLDILMEGRTGMEMAQTLRAEDEQTSILFISSSRGYPDIGGSADGAEEEP